MSAGTIYRISFTVGNSAVRDVYIKACSPMIAFRKFKELMPLIIFNNLLIDEIIECEEKNVIVDNSIKYCYRSIFQFQKSLPQLAIKG